MSLRDEAERVIREWNAYEVAHGCDPVIDFDCVPTGTAAAPAEDRLTVYQQLSELRVEASEPLAARLDADIAFLSAQSGERLPLAAYVRTTQGCGTAGWPESYVLERAAQACAALESLGVGWGPGTADELEQAEEPIPAEDAPAAIRQAAQEFEAAVRTVTGADAPYTLTIEGADVNAYWAYWLDGAGDQVRLRLNQRNTRFTRTSARQFALHEVLGHGLQSVAISARAATENVPWIRLLSVHAPHQVMLEGLAQALPLFVAADDEILIARVRLDHYTQLVRAELHLAINDGATPAECAAHARSRVPWWNGAAIMSFLRDRKSDPMLRSYLWAYPAGIDWFVNLAEADPEVISQVLHAAYRAPLTPTELAALWPAGPPIGGPGAPRRSF